MTPENPDDILANDELAGMTDEERAIAAKLLPIIAAKANAMADANKAKQLEKFMAEVRSENEKQFKAEIEAIRKANLPPTPEQLEKILSQEYLEYTVVLRSNGTQRTFTIRELPIEAETKILKALRRTIKDRMQELSSVNWQDANNTLERVEKILEVVPGALDTLSECVALCLDPFGEDKELDSNWIKKNVGLGRLASIIEAQLLAGRYRDFLSQVSRLIPGQMIV